MLASAKSLIVNALSKSIFPIVFTTSYATRTIAPVGAARAALGPHPANNASTPPVRAMCASSPTIPRRDTPGTVSVEEAKSTGAISRICTRVFTTSRGVVSAATAAPAAHPLTKLIPANSRVVRSRRCPATSPPSIDRNCSTAYQYIALYGTSLASVGPTPVHAFRAPANIPPPLPPALSLSAPTNARPPLCPYTPGLPRRVANTRVRANSNGAHADTANVRLAAPASAGAAFSPTPPLSINHRRA